MDSLIPNPMEDEVSTLAENDCDKVGPRISHGWDDGRGCYACRDGIRITVSGRAADASGQNKARRVPANSIAYARDTCSQTLVPMVDVCEMEFDRRVETISCAPYGTRAVTFPRTVKTVEKYVFNGMDYLQAVVLNENLEVLEGSKSTIDGVCDGAFGYTPITHIVLPASLKVLGAAVFDMCERLQYVTFAEGSTLQEIGEGCFGNCAIEEIQIPSSVTTIHDHVFCGCRALKRVSFQAGSKLERIGKRCFVNSGIEEVEILGTLGTAGARALKDCENLKNVRFLERPETIRKQLL